MEIKSINIGRLQTRNNVFLAPMAGFTGYAFRHTILPLNVGFCFTELVSAKGLFFGGKNNGELLYSEGDYDLTAAQIFGSEPYYMRKACESEFMQKYSVVDINMGCPVPKIYKNGEGSALLKDLHLAENIVKECVKSGKTITVKIRTGLKKGDNVASDFAKMAENSGASLITVHGRTREEYYTGTPDYAAMAKAKASVKIPVIANGGIFTAEDADYMINETGADGVMIARGGIADPFMFEKLCGKKSGITLKEFAVSFLNLFCERYGEKRACVEFRKYASYFYKNVVNGKQIRLSICSTENAEQIKKILSETL